VTLPHHHLASVDSTILEAWRLVDAGEPAPFWLTADEQTQGRGRMARNWISKPGNLYSTLVLPDPGNAHLLPFAVALAVFETARASIGEHQAQRLRLKWPNDVLHDGAKLSGILIERRARAASTRGMDLFAVGIGINVQHAPDVPDRATTALLALADDPAAVRVEWVFDTLMAAINMALARLARAPDALLADWRMRAGGFGEHITVSLGTSTVSGTFDHLAGDGALMLRLPSGALRAIHTGDVVEQVARGVTTIESEAS
jgi:BirA family biotin operon repressor/biotin-[acetyl-CoA-carboxylase] ligase